MLLHNLRVNGAYFELDKPPFAERDVQKRLVFEYRKPEPDESIEIFDLIDGIHFFTDGWDPLQDDI